ncbi:hypothetical protein [Clostridium sp. HBUAS56010]|uniref:hypothetical protein n=1 Tax=Clostridium sp. HBUAS56010 TaxID=2571127 RepID=UPI00117871F1|nr:hypothetical protein [Clostridium sp. HBUAS56010]
MENNNVYDVEMVASVLGGLSENERGLLLSALKIDALVLSANDDVAQEHIAHWIDSYIRVMSNLKDGFIHFIEKIHSGNPVYSYDKEMESFKKFRESISREDKDKIDSFFTENPISVPPVDLCDTLGKSRSFQDVLDDVAKRYNNADEDERKSIVALFSYLLGS